MKIDRNFQFWLKKLYDNDDDDNDGTKLQHNKKNDILREQNNEVLIISRPYTKKNL